MPTRRDEDFNGEPPRRVNRKDNDPNKIGTTEGKQLLAFIERIERIEDDEKQIREDKKDIYAEAKGTGFDTKIMRKLVAERKQDRDKRREEQEIMDLYRVALGMD